MREEWLSSFWRGALRVACLGLAASCAAAIDQPFLEGQGGRYKIGNTYSIGGKSYTPRDVTSSFTESGVASWYGADFHGKKTANGEIFDMNAFSAAHPTLPLPVYVAVRNLENERRLIVRVNDRGPFKKGRIIDLSRAAAKRLGFYEKGTAQVEIRYLRKARLNDRKKRLYPFSASPSPLDAAFSAGILAPEKPAKPPLYVEAGHFESREGAEEFRAAIAKLGRTEIIQTTPSPRTVLYIVRLGPYDDFLDAQAVRAVLRSEGSADVAITPSGGEGKRGEP